MSLTNNYLVTKDQVNTMGIPIVSAAPLAGNECVTKNDLMTYWNVDQSYLTGYASNQGVMYQDIHAPAIYTVTIYAKKEIVNDTLYVYYGENDTSLGSPILLGSALTRAGGVKSPTISAYGGQTLTFTTSDVNGPTNTGYKPTTAQVGSYPAFVNACTGYVTFTITANTSIYIASGNGYTGWC